MRRRVALKVIKLGMLGAGDCDCDDGVDLLFGDEAATAIPCATEINSGAYRPTDCAVGNPVLPPGATGTTGTNITAMATGGVNGD